MLDLSDKSALVTGGSRGIGAATAVLLSELGADVAITYSAAHDRAQQVVEQITANGVRSIALAADNADASAVVAAVDRTAAEFGRLDILVNNAGVFPYGPVDDVSLEELDRTLAVNTRAVFVACQAALRHLPRGGRVISVGSNLAERVPYPGVALYAMSKSALIGLTRGLARDLGERGITVNLVHPGSTATDMVPTDPELVDNELALIPLGRFGQATDVATAIAFLAGPAGQQITGASINVDGGTNA